MAAQSEDCSSQRRSAGHSPRVSLTARRVIVAAIGGVLALSAGTGVAFAFRVSPDVAAADAPDPTVADELPSIAAARAYAMNNPPAYAARLQAPIAAPETTATATATDDDAANAGLDPDTGGATDPPSSAQADLAPASDDGLARSTVASANSPDQASAAQPSD